jgi:hypothetical protein
MNASPPFFTSFEAARSAYREAWADPAHTRFELPPVNVNKVLRDRYRMEPQRLVTRTEIWDMEARKAWDPRTFIPYVVSEARSYGREKLADGSYRFCRASMQRGWIAERYGRVLEDTYVSDAEQAVFFMGRATMPGENGEELAASDLQPVFHVEHAAGGSEDEPLNIWSIVLLTETNDPRYEQPFKEMVRAGLLPGFIEIYIEKNLGMKLSRAG